MSNNLIYIFPFFGIAALIYMYFLSVWVKKQDAGDSKMKEIADNIAEGAMAFLNAEYRILAIFVVIAGILLGILSQVVETSHWLIVVAFVIGAIYIGDIIFFPSNFTHPHIAQEVKSGIKYTAVMWSF